MFFIDILVIVGLKIDISEFPSLGKMAKVNELKIKITNASFFVQAASSIHKIVFPLLSKEGLSSGFTKSNNLIQTDIDVSKLVNIA